MTKPQGLVVHSAAAQQAGYPKGVFVVRDGCIRKNLVTNNPHPPSHLPTWQLHD